MNENVDWEAAYRELLSLLEELRASNFISKELLARNLGKHETIMKAAQEQLVVELARGLLSGGAAQIVRVSDPAMNMDVIALHASVLTVRDRAALDALVERCEERVNGG